MEYRPVTPGFGGEGGIRTHVPEYLDHPISPAAHQVMVDVTTATVRADRSPCVGRDVFRKHDEEYHDTQGEDVEQPDWEHQKTSKSPQAGCLGYQSMLVSRLILGGAEDDLLISWDRQSA